MSELAAPEPASVEATTRALEGRPAQTGVGRAFAGITLFGSLLLMIGPLMPWATYWNRNYGWSPTDTPFMLNGLPTDPLLCLGIGVATACVGAARMAITVPLALRIAQLLVTGFAAYELMNDWSILLVNNYNPAGGITICLFGAIIACVGAFPLWRRD
jgi:hypothetical protein